jgi:hypothetical protein
MWPTTAEEDWAELTETIPYLGRLLSRIRRLRDGGVAEPQPADCPVDLQSAIMPAEAVVDSLDERIKRKRIGIRHPEDKDLP